MSPTEKDADKIRKVITEEIPEKVDNQTFKKWLSDTIFRATYGEAAG